MNIKEKAIGYTAPPKIEDLDQIPIDVQIFDDGEGTNPDTNEPYQFSYIVLNDRQIRVPESIIVQLQEHLKVNPGMRAFKVKSNGKTGLLKRYTAIPIM